MGNLCRRCILGRRIRSYHDRRDGSLLLSESLVLCLHEMFTGSTGTVFWLVDILSWTPLDGFDYASTTLQPRS